MVDFDLTLVGFDVDGARGRVAEVFPAEVRV